jgi:hypothetical protein
MSQIRTVEIFSAGCPLCDEAAATVLEAASPADRVSVVDLRAPGGFEHARALGVRRIPAVAIDGALAPCCAATGLGSEALRAAGPGRKGKGRE